MVIGLVGVVASFGLFLSWESYEATLFKSDRDILVSALHRARSQAVNNMCFDPVCTDGSAHGVYIDTANHQYIVFEGASYATRHAGVDQVYDGTPSVTVAGPTEIVFTELSGAATPGSIVLTFVSGKTSTIDVTSEGRVTWTN
ncbi:MAG: hypothetical protein RLZZ283_385 [Candidatus Parcubacteria bacterium]|jgi:Tfp pilus assembly protein FimT